MRLLLEAIASGQEPVNSGRDNLQTMALLDGAYRSAATGEVAHLPTPGELASAPAPAPAAAGASGG
jgi:hypothetical protein